MLCLLIDGGIGRDRHRVPTGMDIAGRDVLYRRSTRKSARIVVNPRLQKRGEMARDRSEVAGHRDIQVPKREHARTMFSLDGPSTGETVKDVGDG